MAIGALDTHQHALVYLLARPDPVNLPLLLDIVESFALKALYIALVGTLKSLLATLQPIEGSTE